MYLTYHVMINQVIGKFDRVTDFNRLFSFHFVLKKKKKGRQSFGSTSLK